MQQQDLIFLKENEIIFIYLSKFRFFLSFNNPSVLNLLLFLFLRISFLINQKISVINTNCELKIEGITTNHKKLKEDLSGKNLKYSKLLKKLV